MSKVKLTWLLLSILMIGCGTNNAPTEKESPRVYFTTLTGDNYELYKPQTTSKAVIVLFGGYTETPQDIREQFPIVEAATENSLSVLIMDYKYKLWLTPEEKYQLAQTVQDILIEHELSFQEIFIGGFSSGGNIGLLLSDYVVSMKQFYIDPTGVFVIDPPVDLAALYQGAEKKLARNIPEIARRESSFLVELLAKEIGNPASNIGQYEAYSVYTEQTRNVNNILKLKNTKIRFYVEPDTTWWREQRLTASNEINAYYVEKLAKELTSRKFKSIEYISTRNKGFRADGQRHPHSWSIVDKSELIKWMLRAIN